MARALVLGLLLAAAVAAGCGADERALPDQELRIATGPTGGVYTIYGQAVARVVTDHLPPLTARERRTPGGSLEGLKLLWSGSVDVAMTRADSAQHALPARQTKIVVLARIYDSYVQVVTRADSGIRRISELRSSCRGRCRVWVGEPGSGTELIARRVLAAAGLTRHVERNEMPTIDEAVAALEARRIDAIIWAGGVPTPAIDTSHVDLEFVDLGRAAGRLVRTYRDVYASDDLRPDPDLPAYDARPGTRTVRMANYIVVRATMPDEVAHALTATLFRHRRQLRDRHPEARFLSARRSAIDTYPFALHPGAARYYRETAAVRMRDARDAG